MALKILKFMPRESNTLRGFVDIRYGSLVIRGCSVHLKDGSSWVTLHRRPMIDRSGVVLKDVNGKTRYQLLIRWSTKAASQQFSKQVIETLVSIYPNALDFGKVAAPLPLISGGRARGRF